MRKKMIKQQQTINGTTKTIRILYKEKKNFYEMAYGQIYKKETSVNNCGVPQGSIYNVIQFKQNINDVFAIEH